MPTVALIANPRAGRGRALATAASARGRLTGAGIDAELMAPSAVTEIPAAVDRAQRLGATAVIACGGDGTVHQVLQSVHAAGLPLGILPLGTGNDIARSLDLPVGDLDAWVDVIADVLTRGATRTVDLARIDTAAETIWSLAVTSVGFDSAVNERADRMQRIPGTLRYVTAVIGELAALSSHQVTLLADGTTVAGAATLVAIGNGPTYGGGMRICPDARLDDGLLHVTWVDAAPRRTILRVFPQIFSGRHIEHPMVRTMTAREVRVEAPTAVAYTDGERVGPAVLAISAEPEALSVVAR